MNPDKEKVAPDHDKEGLRGHYDAPLPSSKIKELQERVDCERAKDTVHGTPYGIDFFMKDNPGRNMKTLRGLIDQPEKQLSRVDGKVRRSGGGRHAEASPEERQPIADEVQQMHLKKRSARVHGAYLK